MPARIHLVEPEPELQEAEPRITRREPWARVVLLAACLAVGAWCARWWPW